MSTINEIERKLFAKNWKFWINKSSLLKDLSNYPERNEIIIPLIIKFIKVKKDNLESFPLIEDALNTLVKLTSSIINYFRSIELGKKIIDFDTSWMKKYEDSINSLNLNNNDANYMNELVELAAQLAYHNDNGIKLAAIEYLGLLHPYSISKKQIFIDNIGSSDFMISIASKVFMSICDKDNSILYFLLDKLKDNEYSEKTKSKIAMYLLYYPYDKQHVFDKVIEYIKSDFLRIEINNTLITTMYIWSIGLNSKKLEKNLVPFLLDIVIKDDYFDVASDALIALDVNSVPQIIEKLNSYRWLSEYAIGMYSALLGNIGNAQEALPILTEIRNNQKTLENRQLIQEDIDKIKTYYDSNR